MEKMPLEYFGYYTMLEPFAAGYYELGEKEKARKILTQLIGKYQETLTYYNTLKSNEQMDLYVEIVTDIERYRDLLSVMKDRGDKTFYEQSKPAFNTYNNMFPRFKRDKE